MRGAPGRERGNVSPRGSWPGSCPARAVLDDRSRSCLLRCSRSRDEDVPEASAASAPCFLWEQQSTKPPARQLHEKLIVSNLVRKLQPLGKHSTAFRVLGRRAHWMSGLEEIN